jgi:hypothetical protein
MTHSVRRILVISWPVSPANNNVSTTYRPIMPPSELHNHGMRSAIRIVIRRRPACFPSSNHQPPRVHGESASETWERKISNAVIFGNTVLPLGWYFKPPSPRPLTSGTTWPRTISYKIHLDYESTNFYADSLRRWRQHGYIYLCARQSSQCGRSRLKRGLKKKPNFALCQVSEFL